MNRNPVYSYSYESSESSSEYGRGLYNRVKMDRHREIEDSDLSRYDLKRH